MNKKHGFVLIELIIVIAIMIFLLGAVIVSYRSFEKKTELENTARNILITLKLAQNKTLASENDSQYGVHFESDKYILFKGDAYESGSPDNEINQLSNRLEIYNINLTGSGSDIIFQRINGNTNQDGIIDLRLISDPEKTKSIDINSFGQIELDSSLTECCNTNRLTDNRHIHLNLNWSIQNADILTLYFPDMPEVTENINMIDYFNADQTEFNWSGTINVNDQDQKLSIKTHFLDEFNTILCIHRSRDENNKPLQILIDNKDIVSYDINGEISIGFFGGTVEIQ